jgi:hypothetical protein
MKNALFALFVCAICLNACQKNETANPETALVGTWSMCNIEHSTEPNEDLLGPGFTFESFNELFTSYDVEFTDQGTIQFIPISPETEPEEMGTLRFKERPAQHVLQCFLYNDSEPIVFTYRFLEEGKMEVVTEDGVRMVFLAR